MAQQAGDYAVAASGAAELGFVVPVGVAQDAVKAWCVLFLNCGTSTVEHFAEVHRLAHNGIPTRLNWDKELVFVKVAFGDLYGDTVGNRVVDLFSETV